MIPSARLLAPVNDRDSGDPPDLLLEGTAFEHRAGDQRYSCADSRHDRRPIGEGLPAQRC